MAELTALLEGGDRATIILSCGLGEARPALQGAGWGYPAICLSTDSRSQQFPVLAMVEHWFCSFPVSRDLRTVAVIVQHLLVEDTLVNS